MFIVLTRPLDTLYSSSAFGGSPISRGIMCGIQCIDEVTLEQNSVMV